MAQNKEEQKESSIKRFQIIIFIGLVIFLMITAFIACDDDGDDNGNSNGNGTQDTIVDIAAADDRFQTLITALEAADLVETLQGDGPFTVFAPTDDAFDALTAGTVDALLNDIPALTDILLYHVVSGKVMATDVVELDSETTVQGDEVTIMVDGSDVFINDAQVIITDIEASNGMIHVIDTVLIPA